MLTFLIVLAVIIGLVLFVFALDVFLFDILEFSYIDRIIDKVKKLKKGNK